MRMSMGYVDTDYLDRTAERLSDVKQRTYSHLRLAAGHRVLVTSNDQCVFGARVTLSCHGRTSLSAQQVWSGLDDYLALQGIGPA